MLYWICLLLVLAPLLLERRRLQRGRAKVPVRIHVHGTRGKSSITRALAATLSAQGLRVLAKTTGDRAEYILPGGAVIPVRRVGPARIKEHIRMLHKAAAMGMDAVVVEGMALQPETVCLSERILQATHAVIANTRPDHAETMGNGREGVLQTLRHMIPCAGELFTADEAGADSLKEQASRKNVPCSVVKAPLTQQAPGLARAVAGSLLPVSGLPQKQSTLHFSALSSPVETEISGTPVCVYDYLSANDVLSSQLMLQARSLRTDFYTVALFATRADRPLRTRDFMNWILAETRFDAVAVMGSHAGYALLRALLSRASNRFLRVRPGLPPKALVNAMRKKALAQGRKGLTVVALGNVHGYGEKWRAAMGQAALFASGADRDAEEIEGYRHAD